MNEGLYEYVFTPARPSANFCFLVWFNFLDFSCNQTQPSKLTNPTCKSRSDSDSANRIIGVKVHLVSPPSCTEVHGSTRGLEWVLVLSRATHTTHETLWNLNRKRLACSNNSNPQQSDTYNREEPRWSASSNAAAWKKTSQLYWTNAQAEHTSLAV